MRLISLSHFLCGDRINRLKHGNNEWEGMGPGSDSQRWDECKCKCKESERKRWMRASKGKRKKEGWKGRLERKREKDETKVF